MRGKGVFFIKVCAAVFMLLFFANVGKGEPVFAEESFDYQVVYDAGTGIVDPEPVKCSFDTEFSLKEKTDVGKKGYVLSAWTTKPKGKGKSYKPGKTVKNLTKKEGKTVKLYAVWKKKSSKVLGTVEQAECISPGCVRVSGNAEFSSGRVDGDVWYLVAVNQESGSIEYLLGEQVKTGPGPLSFDIETNDRKAAAWTVTKGITGAAIEGYRPVTGKFAFALKDASGTLRLATKAMYVQHPENMAKEGYFEKTSTKKGIQGPEAFFSGNDLNVKHVFYNIYAADIIHPELGGNYEYNGKMYSFDASAQTKEISTLYQAGVSVTVQVMLGRGDVGDGYGKISNMIHSKARKAGKMLYSWENREKKGREEIEALFCYLSEALGGGNPLSPAYVSNWILGNEVNSYKVYQYKGSMSKSEFLKSYAETFRTLSAAIRSQNRDARVYICADQCWGVGAHGYSAKTLISGFNSKLKAMDPTMPWNLAFHPYANPLTQTEFWKSETKDGSGALAYVTMKNIGKMISYVNKSTFARDGKAPNIILSELGYSSENGGTEKTQAAALAYTYAIVAENPAIDAIMIRSLVDDPNDGALLKLGLIQDGAHFYAQKKAYNIWKFCDTKEYDVVYGPDAAYFKVVKSSAKDWEDVWSSFDESTLVINNSD